MSIKVLLQQWDLPLKIKISLNGCEFICDHDRCRKVACIKTERLICTCKNEKVKPTGREKDRNLSTNVSCA